MSYLIAAILLVAFLAALLGVAYGVARVLYAHALAVQVAVAFVGGGVVAAAIVIGALALLLEGAYGSDKLLFLRLWLPLALGLAGGIACVLAGFRFGWLRTE